MLHVTADGTKNFHTFVLSDKSMGYRCLGVIEYLDPSLMRHTPGYPVAPHFLVQTGETADGRISLIRVEGDWTTIKYWSVL